MLLSDVHIEPILNRQDETNIAAILEIAKQRQPDAIMIAGDFLDTLEVLYCEVILEKIKSFLHILNSIAPVYIGVGNHDLGIGFQARQAKYELKMFSEYQSFIFSTPANLLHNSSAYLDASKEIKILGLTLPPEYYNLDKDKHLDAREKHKCLENMLVENAKGVNEDFTVALVHSPEHLDVKMRKTCPGIDLFISGHLHDGLVPVGIFGLTRFSDRGLISSDGSLFPARARGTSRDLDNGLLILGAVKAIPTDVSRAFQLMARPLFPPEISFLHLIPE